MFPASNVEARPYSAQLAGTVPFENLRALRIGRPVRSSERIVRRIVDVPGRLEAPRAHLSVAAEPPWRANSTHF